MSGFRPNPNQQYGQPNLTLQQQQQAYNQAYQLAYQAFAQQQQQQPPPQGFAQAPGSGGQGQGFGQQPAYYAPPNYQPSGSSGSATPYATPSGQAQAFYANLPFYNYGGTASQQTQPPPQQGQQTQPLGGSAPLSQSTPVLPSAYPSSLPAPSPYPLSGSGGYGTQSSYGGYDPSSNPMAAALSSITPGGNFGPAPMKPPSASNLPFANQYPVGFGPPRTTADPQNSPLIAQGQPQQSQPQPLPPTPQPQQQQKPQQSQPQLPSQLPQPQFPHGGSMSQLPPHSHGMRSEAQSQLYAQLKTQASSPAVPSQPQPQPQPQPPQVQLQAQSQVPFIPSVPTSMPKVPASIPKGLMQSHNSGSSGNLGYNQPVFAPLPQTTPTADNQAVFKPFSSPLHQTSAPTPQSPQSPQMPQTQSLQSPQTPQTPPQQQQMRPAAQTPPIPSPQGQLQPLQMPPQLPPKIIPPRNPLPQTPAQKQEDERRKQEELEEVRRKLEEERRKRAEEDRKKLEETLRLKKQEEEAKRKAEDEKKRRKSAVELEEMKQQIAQRLLKEEEEKKTKLELERSRQEEELKKHADLMQQQLQLRLKEEEERIRRELEERLRAEQERERQKWEAEWKKRTEEEAQRLQEEERRRREKEEALIKEHEERLQREREERQKWEQQLAEIRAKEEEERQKRVKSEKHLRKQARREARKKMAAEVEKVKKREAEEKKKLAEQLQSMQAALESAKQQETQVVQQKFENLARTTQLLNAEKMQAELARIAAENKAKEEQERIKKALEEQFRQEELALKRQLEEEKRKIAEETAKRLNTSHFEIDLKEVEIVSSLGKGAFGEVFKGRLHGKDVAVKKLFNQKVDDDALIDFKQEITIMSNLHHPNILLFMGACTKPGSFAIITELMPRGSLEDIIFTQKLDLSLRLRLKMLKDAAMGMNWLHRLKPAFLHRDLKTGNLLVDENWTVKVADFGLSSIKSLDEDGNKVTGAVGSPFYMAPEVLVDKEYDEKADVYSFAIIVWEVLSGEEPYKDEFESFDELVEAITLDNQRPTIPAWFPPTLKAFVESLWADAPEKRPSFEYILRERRLDSIAIDCMLKDPLANDFWKTNFSESWDSVPWADFVKAFNEYFEKPLDNNTFYARCCKQLLSSISNGKEVVAVDDFIKILYWFGPLDADTTFLSRISLLCAQPYFFGELSTADAELLLKGKKSSGTWLARFGDIKLEVPNTRELFISVIYKHVVQHHKFTQNVTTGKYQFKTGEYSSIDELLKANKKALKLKTPCTGSRFEPFAKGLKPPRELQL